MWNLKKITLTEADRKIVTRSKSVLGVMTSGKCWSKNTYLYLGGKCSRDLFQSMVTIVNNYEVLLRNVKE
jgi:hypothetical protein